MRQSGVFGGSSGSEYTKAISSIESNTHGPTLSDLLRIMDQGRQTQNGLMHGVAFVQLFTEWLVVLVLFDHDQTSDIFTSNNRRLAVLQHHVFQQYPGTIPSPSYSHNSVQHIRHRPAHFLFPLRDLGAMLGSDLPHDKMLLHRNCHLLRVRHDHLSCLLPNRNVQGTKEILSWST